MINRLVIAILCVIFYSCNNLDRNKIVDKSLLLGDDYRLFQNTPAWELAKAVQDEDETEITEIVAKKPNLINYQEPKFGNTLLMMTVENQQYRAFKMVLRNKANLNIHNTYEGSSALIEACSSKHYDLKFVETLLQYGANVNDVQADIEKEGKTRTPLMVASKTGELDLVKVLIKNGADVNYQNGYKQSALTEAVMTDRYNIAIYLLENGADYKKPIFFREEENRKMYLVDVLREDFFELNTNDYKYKTQIIDFLKSKGKDYRSTPIPEYIKKEAQERYPDSWQEYLEKY